MAATLTRRRTYDVTPPVLLGCCQAALARLRAAIERQDLDRGTLVASVGGGVLGPISELSLEVAPEGADRARLTVTWRARKLGGDRTILPSFLASVDALARGG
jgi:hypothetical protein